LSRFSSPSSYRSSRIPEKSDMGIRLPADMWAVEFRDGVERVQPA